MNKNKVLVKNKDIVSREIRGEVILMPLYTSSKDLNYIYTLNETASHVWSLIDGKRSLPEIKNHLINKYQVNETKLDKELNGFIKDLRSIKALF